MSDATATRPPRKEFERGGRPAEMVSLAFACGCVAVSGPGNVHRVEWCPYHAKTHETLTPAGVAAAPVSLS